MPLYALACNGTPSHEYEAYLVSYGTPNPACAKCEAPTERVWRGKQHHGELTGWPMVTKMLDGVERSYANRGEWERAVKEKGYRVRDDASWQHESLGNPVYNWRTKKTEYPERHTVMGVPGVWI